MLKRYYPLDAIPADKVACLWKGQHDKLEFMVDGTGQFINRQGKSQPFTYEVSGNTINITMNEVTTGYFMQNDQLAIYSVIPDGRYTGRKERFTK